MRVYARAIYRYPFSSSIEKNAMTIIFRMASKEPRLICDNFLDPLSLKLDFHMYMRDEGASRSRASSRCLFAQLRPFHRITEVC